jgi:hypothetical protein
VNNQPFPNLLEGGRPLSTTRYLVVDNDDKTLYEGTDVNEAKQAWASTPEPRAWSFTTMTYSFPLNLGPEADRAEAEAARSNTRWKRATRALGKAVFPWFS